MTLATYNQCVDLVTGVNKTGLSSARHGARHAGARESALNSLIRIASLGQAQGKHARIKAKHGKKK
jgi:hypothetical protein